MILPPKKSLYSWSFINKTHCKSITLKEKDEHQREEQKKPSACFIVSYNFDDSKIKPCEKGPPGLHRGTE